MRKFQAKRGMKNTFQVLRFVLLANSEVMCFAGICLQLLGAPNWLDLLCLPLLCVGLSLSRDFALIKYLIQIYVGSDQSDIQCSLHDTRIRRFCKQHSVLDGKER